MHRVRAYIFDFLQFFYLSLIGSRVLSFKRPLLSLSVEFCMYVCMWVCMSATLRSNISKTKGAMG